MPMYEIWIEGYKCTGEQVRAECLGSAAGNTFKEACNEFMKTYPDSNIFYEKGNNTYWGCDLFDNETDARSYFG